MDKPNFFCGGKSVSVEELRLMFQTRTRGRKIDLFDSTYKKLEKMTREKYGDMSRINASLVINSCIDRVYECFIKKGWI